MDIEKKKYKVVNLMYWDEHEQDDNVECTSLSYEYTNIRCAPETELYPDSNKYIGKPRYFYMTLDKILNHVYEKENIDLFCKNNSECYNEEFNIWNFDYEMINQDMVIKYKPIRNCDI